jgi:hypothetical protein
MANEVDISENELLEKYPEVLEKLLLDHTTHKHIFWATDSYAEQGAGYQFADEITIENITGPNGRVIQPRSVKERAVQTQRAKDMAEVFTPSWICNAQNNLIDDAWFGRKHVFNVEDEESHTWTPTEEKITFPEGKTWQDYVKDIRLEITCGEGPYLVSRYDTVSGEPILPLNKRVGILDRKLRVVTENAKTSGEWLNWAKTALMATYGFEWQGDNLLLAREALFYTFCEYYEARFKKPVPRRSLDGVAYIVSWNLWQMDGLKFVIPCSCDNLYETSLFGVVTKRECAACRKGEQTGHIGIPCRIKDWFYTGKDETKQKPYFTSLLNLK